MNMNSMKKQEDMTPEAECPGWKMSNMLLGKSRGHINSFRKDEVAEPKQKRCPVVDVPGRESKVQCCKE